MSKPASLAIPKSYQRLGAFPLDDSTVLETIEQRNSMVEGVRYVGMISYVEETNGLYLLKGGLTNDCWTELNTGDTTIEGVKSYVVKNSNISKGQVVRLVDSLSVEPADVNGKYTSVIGIALNDANIDDKVMIQMSGETSIVNGKTLTVGNNCFLGTDGNVVQTLEDSPLMLYVGVATASNKILVSIDNEVVIFE